MKKITVIFLILFTVMLVSIYLFIPAKISFTKVIYVEANQNSVSRYISDESKWSKWLPGDTISHKSEKRQVTYFYKNYSYVISHKALEGTMILIKNNSVAINSFLHFIAINRDSVAIEWKGLFPETNNPFKMIKNYLLATRVKNNISEILLFARKFLEDKKKLYGLNIIQEKVKDTILISTKTSFSSFPSTAAIYSLLTNLKKYIALNGATENNYPMLNISQDSSTFKTIVAISINKLIPENNKFIIKKMVPGKILVTEVTGGSYILKEALEKLQMYMDDNHLTSPAIYFESLVTDRLKEPDSSKWITRIYYPIY